MSFVSPQPSVFPMAFPWDTLRVSGNKSDCFPWDKSFYLNVLIVDQKYIRKNMQDDECKKQHMSSLITLMNAKVCHSLSLKLTAISIVAFI